MWSFFILNDKMYSSDQKRSAKCERSIFFLNSTQSNINIFESQLALHMQSCTKHFTHKLATISQISDLCKLIRILIDKIRICSNHEHLSLFKINMELKQLNTIERLLLILVAILRYPCSKLLEFQLLLIHKTTNPKFWYAIHIAEQFIPRDG